MRERKEVYGKRYDDLSYIATILVICSILLYFTPTPAYIIFGGGGILIAILILPKIRTFKGYIYSLFSWFFGIIVMLIVVTYAIKTSPPYVVGDNLVLVEIIIVPGLYLKPITILMYSFFLWLAFGLYSPGNLQRFKKMIPDVRHLIYIFAWFGAMASGFELVYHIVVWSAALAVQGLQNPDVIVNPWPWSAHAPINVVFSSKIIVLIFAISCFTIDYLRRIEMVYKQQES